MKEKDRSFEKEPLPCGAAPFSKDGHGMTALDEYRDVYQDLFDHVPCFITVQDKNYELLRYNREFDEAFDPKPGDRCYQAYKKRSEKCEICPVEKTFKDGRSHWSEESGPNKFGTTLHWLVKTSPIKNAKGDIVAVMEMCLDITHKIKLEEKLAISEKKYHDIFNNMPNPLFVLDMETYEILDCNGGVKSVYGYAGEEIISSSFLTFFKPEEREHYASVMRDSSIVDRARHVTKDGRELFVNIRISPSEHLNQKTYLVTTSDITQQLEIEAQLIQASKMATLGEMATGLAHELNQPLSVINTASNFFVRKINKKENIEHETLLKLSDKIVSNVDRATKIINHMREFGRKSDMHLEKVDISGVLRRAYEVMSQQLKLRGIDVQWQLQDGLPMIEADSVRLEQVFINLLLNARDAIEEKMETAGDRLIKGEITVNTRLQGDGVTIEVCDTGPGIPDAIKDKVFEPFFTTKKVGKGTGLGLSISYGIVRECGGTIGAFSERGSGACFVVHLPVPGKAEKN
ncbi:MAG: ATP-binding protein [Pseudomonadota bacterium]